MKIKCYNCGGEVIVTEGSHIGICSACMAEIPIPEVPEVDGSYSQANQYLSESEFEKARDEFHNILVSRPLESAALWGMAISEYGIEYVVDPASGEHLPTMHRLSRQYFTENQYYKQAVSCAPSLETREFYEHQGKLIDEIQRRSLEISSQEEPYDIFICYKQTETGEKRTADSRMAGDFYRELTRRGYKVFFAEKTLVSGEEYEPRIFAALQSARIMIAIASKPEYYTAVWVQNEWSRYLDLLNQKEEGDGIGRLLIPMFQNMTHEELPSGLQAMPKYVEMDRSANARQALLTLVAEHFEVEETVHSEDVSRIRRDVGTAESVSMEVSADKLATRALIALTNGEFKEAEKFYQEALKLSKSPDIYWGLLMCSLQVPGNEALHQYSGDIRGEKYYKMALNAAAGEKKAEYEAIANGCLENAKWAAEVNKSRSSQKKIGNRVISEVEQAALSMPSFDKYHAEEQWMKNLREEKKFTEGRTMFKWLELFLLSAFLLPLFYTVNKGDIPSAMIIVPIVLFVALAVGCFVFLGEAFGWGVIVRLIILVVVVNVFAEFMIDSRKEVTLLTLAVNVVYYLAFGLRRWRKQGAYKAHIRQLKMKKKNVPDLEEEMMKDISAYLEKEMDACRGYYTTPQGYKESLAPWIDLAGHSVKQMLDYLYVL